MQKIEHLGLNVPDVEAALAYYDEYPSVEEGAHSRLRTGLSHIAFNVPARDDVHRVHEWAVGRGHEILNAPRLFPEYGEHCYATFFLDMHDFMLEATCHTAP